MNKDSMNKYEIAKKARNLGIIITFLISIILLLPPRHVHSKSIKNFDEIRKVGKQYLVLIAIDKYENWRHLAGSVRDAHEISEILESRYYIDEVFELYNENATKRHIIELFSRLRFELEEDDSLLIFYSGHGYLDNVSRNGYWIPYDGGSDRYKKDRWIHNLEIRGIIAQMKSKHILLISDSCFSERLLTLHRRAFPTIDNSSLQEAYSRRSRLVLTSGASEIVPDQSSFANQIKIVLRENTRPYIDSNMLYNGIRLGIKETMPIYGEMRRANHQQGASFILFLKESIRSSPKLPLSESINDRLFESVKSGDMKLVKSLLKKGASLDEEDEEGRTPLYYAISNGFKEIEKLLIKKGAKINEKARLTALAEFWKNKGNDFFKQKEYTKAIGCFKQALNYYEEAGELKGQLIPLNNIGELYKKLNQHEEAFKYFEIASSIIKEIDLYYIAIKYGPPLFSSDDEIAVEYYREFGYPGIGWKDKTVVDVVLNNFYETRETLKQYKKTIEYYEKELKVSRWERNRDREGSILNKIGESHNTLCKYKQAVEYYEQALPIMIEVKNRSGESATLKNMMSTYRALNRLSLAIFYGKQSVIALHEIKKNTGEAVKDIPKDRQKSVEDTYRELAILLTEQGRIIEAQENLNMLKREEYLSFTRGRENVSFGLSEKEYFSKFERKWNKKYNQIMSEISSIGAKYHTLRNKKHKSTKEIKQMKTLEPKLEQARKAANEFMVKLKEAFEKYDRKREKSSKYEKISLAETASSFQSSLEELDKKESVKNAIINYIVFGGRIIMIITTPYYQLVKTSEIDEEKLIEMIMNFRNKKKIEAASDSGKRGEVMYISPGYLDFNKSIYDIVFKPVDEELKKYGATNLMIYLDGVLRYLPLTALWDGKNYLVQRYRMAIFTLSSLDRIKDSPTDEKRILGFGASQGGQDFPPIPYAKEEIKLIVNDKEKGYNGLIEGKAFIDDDFTAQVMEDQLKYIGGYPYVHIASHFRFSPGDESNCYLLLGDGNIMRLNEVRLKGNLFYDVDILVLSACETGRGGNGKEIECFGELAQQRGAKSVVATLWPVVDISTKELMVKFYRILKEGIVTSKIEALRQAQLELAGLPDLLGKDESTINNDELLKKKSKYSHPYYWGPFIMIGNWR